MGNGHVKGSTTKELEQTEYLLRWRIPHFFHKTCPRDSTDFPLIKSPLVTAGELHDKPLKWEMSLEGRKNKLSLSLILKSLRNTFIDPMKFFMFTATVGLGNHGWQPMYLSQLENVDCQSQNEKGVWTWPDFMSIDQLHKKKRENPLNSLNGSRTLHVTVQLLMYGKGINAVVPPLAFRGLLNSKKFSDVEIKCSDTTFHCHRLILAAGSNVFHKMFSEQMTFTSCPCIVINDLEPDVMYAIISYIYTGKLDPGVSVCWNDLIYGAEKYQLEGLKEFSLNTIKNLCQDFHVPLDQVSLAPGRHYSVEKLI